MKGIILAGGTGSRLYPLTKTINKHILPVYRLPMIYYPLQTLIDANINEILIVSGKGHCGQFLELLGDGSEFGVNLSYTVQEKPGGIAQALSLTRKFAKNDNMAVILGDNIFEDRFDFKGFREGAKIYLKEVPNPQRFGTAKLDDKGQLIEIIEKPINPPSNFAVTGLYLYDDNVFDIIDCLKPSERNELEITDVNNVYIKERKMDYDIIQGFWSDAGQFESLFRASSFIRDSTIKKDQNMK